MPSIALIDEGDHDTEALSPLIQRVNPGGVQIHPRPCNGHAKGRFQRRLKEFRYVRVDRAVVVCDANGGDHVAVRQRLIQEISHQGFPFGIEFVVLVRELEALLLADPRAIEMVCAQRGSAIAPLPDLTESPELLPDPKARLETILQGAGIKYTKVVAGEITSNASLESLEYWCPSYRRLREAVRLG